MREDYLIAIANLVNGSLLGYEDRSRVPEYEKTVEDYVDSLEKENEKYKEVIKKLKKRLRLQDILANDKNNPQTVSFKKILEYIEYLERKYNNEWSNRFNWYW